MRGHTKPESGSLVFDARVLSVDDLRKAGEGSRGGKIIGHTKSGKPVYAGAHPLSATYGGFSASDHEDAARAHNDHADEARWDIRYQRTTPSQGGAEIRLHRDFADGHESAGRTVGHPAFRKAEQPLHSRIVGAPVRGQATNVIHMLRASHAAASRMLERVASSRKPPPWSPQRFVAETGRAVKSADDVVDGLGLDRDARRAVVKAVDEQAKAPLGYVQNARAAIVEACKSAGVEPVARGVILRRSMALWGASEGRHLGKASHDDDDESPMSRKIRKMAERKARAAPPRHPPAFEGATVGKSEHFRESNEKFFGRSGGAAKPVASAAGRGAGSRGGHVIGHTRSGKPIYAPKYSVTKNSDQSKMHRQSKIHRQSWPDTERGSKIHGLSGEDHADMLLAHNAERADHHAKQKGMGMADEDRGYHQRMRDLHHAAASNHHYKLHGRMQELGRQPSVGYPRGAPRAASRAAKSELPDETNYDGRARQAAQLRKAQDPRDLVLG